MTTYRRTATREALGALHRFGAPLAIAAAVVVALTEIVDGLRAIVPDEWQLGVAIAGVILGACGRALGPVENRVASRRRGPGERRRGTGGRFVRAEAPPDPGITERAAGRVTKRAAATRDPSRVDIPVVPKDPGRDALRDLVRTTPGRDPSQRDRLSDSQMVRLADLVAAKLRPNTPEAP